MSGLKLTLAGGVAVLAFSVASPSEATTILTYEVGGTDNLYHTDWGHPYAPALGTGDPAGSVESGSPFDFSPYSAISVTATGCVEDKGSICTGPDGDAGLFRDLRVYSLIGLWSSDGISITPLGSPFFVGSSAQLTVPTGGPAYLFLAENDGGFDDNVGAYDVTIRVPEPTTLLLLAGALGGLALSRRRRAS